MAKIARGTDAVCARANSILVAFPALLPIVDPRIPRISSLSLSLARSLARQGCERAVAMRSLASSYEIRASTGFITAPGTRSCDFRDDILPARLLCYRVGYSLDLAAAHLAFAGGLTVRLGLFCVVSTFVGISKDSHVRIFIRIASIDTCKWNEIHYTEKKKR